jgi:hypothetical protein
VSTNAPSGYTLSISTDSPDLTHTVNGSRKLTSVNGSVMAPASFAFDGCNKWGWALPRGQAGQYGLLPNNFPTAITAQSNVAPSAVNTGFATVPTSPLMIKRLNTTTSGDTTELFFGVCVDNTTLGGLYKGTITLTAAVADPMGSDDSVGGQPVMDIDSNMVPIKFTGDAVTPQWQKADSANTNNDWYSYDDKRWANAVTFTDVAKLAQYQAAPAGTVIPEADIGAYWVYIPRYRYQLQTLDYAHRPTTPTPFSIQFEDMSQPGYAKADPANAGIQPMVGD